MIGQYLPNNNETATVAFRQKFCQLNSLKGMKYTGKQNTSSLKMHASSTHQHPMLALVHAMKVMETLPDASDPA
jgi:hypothetical protein